MSLQTREGTFDAEPTKGALCRALRCEISLELHVLAHNEHAVRLSGSIGMQGGL